MSSCNVTENKCAISPANAGGSVLQESCNAGATGAAAISPRLEDSSAGSVTCTIKESCNARGERCLPWPYPVHVERVQAWRAAHPDRKSTRLNSSHEWISYAVFCLKKKKKK